MPAAVKFLIGLLAVAILAWVHHGPLGQGEKLIDGLEEQARAAVVESEVPGVQVRLGRDPLSRAATLSGTANDYQREGMGQFPGLNDRVRAIEGISLVRWTNSSSPAGGGNRVMPLLLESLSLLVIAYLIGVGVSWLFFGRAERDSYV